MVAEEVAHVVDVPFVIVARYDGDWATDCASYPPDSGISTVGTRWSLDGTNVMSLVRQRVAPARIDDYSQLDGQIADHARDVGLKHTVGVPVLVAGRLWGVMIASTGHPLPGDTADRLARFTELVATAIANAESREALARLAEQQAALRRIATLVARSTRPRRCSPRSPTRWRDAWAPPTRKCCARPGRLGCRRRCACRPGGRDAHRR